MASYNLFYHAVYCRMAAVDCAGLGLTLECVLPVSCSKTSTLSPTGSSIGCAHGAHVCPPELKVMSPAHTKQLGWYLEFEFRDDAGMTKSRWASLQTRSGSAAAAGVLSRPRSWRTCLSQLIPMAAC